MQIIYANAFYSPNTSTGGNAHVYQFIRNCVKLGHTIWTYPPDVHPDAQRLPHQRSARLVCMRGADVYYLRLETHVPRAAHWAIPPWRLLLRRKTLVVWEFNTLPATDAHTLATFRRYNEGVDLAVCVSQPLAEYVKTVIGIQRTIVVPNGSDPEMFRPEAVPVERVVKDSQRLNVVWTGNANPVYGNWYDFDLLREAAVMLWRSRYKDAIQFHIIGPGYGLMRSMPPNVHYHGPEDYRLMPHWLVAMDVGLLLYSDRNEGVDYISPIKLFDYMASGLAVTGTALPQVKEVFDKLGYPDLLIEQNEPELLVRVLLRFYHDRDLLRQCGQRGRELVVQKYNWQRAVKQVLEAIGKLRDGCS